MMKVCAISDIHGRLEEPSNMPSADVLCICGDIVPLDYQRDYEASIAWFCLEFVPWTDSLPYQNIVFVGGNHDFFLERLHRKDTETVWDRDNSVWAKEYRWRSPSDVLKKLLPGNNKSKHKLTYLCDNSVEISGKRFYGTPWIADLSRWAFYLPENLLTEKYNQIPKKCDVLLTHMPPKLKSVGEVLQVNSYNVGSDYGSQILADTIMSRNITWSISGHVHSGVHLPQEIKPGSYVANVSIKNEDYISTYSPLIFDI